MRALDQVESWESWGRQAYLKAAVKRLREEHPDGIREDFANDDITDCITDLDDEQLATVLTKARGKVEWEYRPDGNGVAINVKGLAAATDLDLILELVLPTLRQRALDADIRRLGAVLGACEAEQSEAVRAQIVRVSGYRQLMQGMI